MMSLFLALRVRLFFFVINKRFSLPVTIGCSHMMIHATYGNGSTRLEPKASLLSLRHNCSRCATNINQNTDH